MRSTDDTSARRERIIVLAICAGVLAVNLLTASRSPTVWFDEVLFADPAVNLVTGKGFVTTAWPQPRDVPFSVNAPLYSLLLAGWIKLLGFSITSVRSLNYVLMMFVGLVLWDTVRRRGIMQNWVLRVTLLVLLFCGYGISFSYRSGRYDILGILLISSMFAVSYVNLTFMRSILLFALGATVPFVGLQLLPYCGLLMLLALWLGGTDSVGRLYPGLAGLLAGIAGFYVLYVHLGMWSYLTDFILAQTDDSLPQKLLSGVQGIGLDFSVLPLVLTLVLLSLKAVKTNEVRVLVPAISGLALFCLIPVALAVVGKYPVYYTWMTFVPVTFCVLTAIDRYLAGRWNTVVAVVCTVTVLAAALVGLPARVLTTFTEWRARDYGPVRQLVSTNVRHDDWAYCSHAAYYAAREVAGIVFTPLHRASLTAADRSRLSVVVCSASRCDGVLRGLGGDWGKVGEYRSPATYLGPLKRLDRGKLYHLAVYRRHDPQ